MAPPVFKFQVEHLPASAAQRPMRRNQPRTSLRIDSNGGGERFSGTIRDHWDQHILIWAV